MSRHNTVRRISALEARDGTTWLGSARVIDEKATAALRWLLTLYKTKRANAVGAVTRAAANKDESRILRRAFAKKVVDLLEVIDPKHRAEFLSRVRSADPPTPDEKKAAQ